MASGAIFEKKITPEEQKENELIDKWIEENLPNNSTDMTLRQYVETLCDVGQYEIDEVLGSLFPKKVAAGEKESYGRIIKWLQQYMPELPPPSADLYSRLLNEGGYDSAAILNTVLKQRNIQFMKRGHRRCLVRLLHAQDHPGFNDQYRSKESEEKLSTSKDEFNKVINRMRLPKEQADKIWGNVSKSILNSVNNPL